VGDHGNVDPCPMNLLPNATLQGKDTKCVINTRDESDTPPPHVFHQGDIYFTNTGLQLVKFIAKPGQKIIVKQDGLELVDTATSDQSTQASSGFSSLNGTFNFSINLDNLNSNRREFLKCILYCM
jgi:hypothetical protein